MLYFGTYTLELAHLETADMLSTLTPSGFKFCLFCGFISSFQAASAMNCFISYVVILCTLGPCLGRRGCADVHVKSRIGVGKPYHSNRNYSFSFLCEGVMGKH